MHVIDSLDTAVENSQFTRRSACSARLAASANGLERANNHLRERRRGTVPGNSQREVSRLRSRLVTDSQRPAGPEWHGWSTPDPPCAATRSSPLHGPAEFSLLSAASQKSRK